MARHGNFSFHFRGTNHSRIEIVDLDPQRYTVAVRLARRIADLAVVMFNLKSVQLENQCSI